MTNEQVIRSLPLRNLASIIIRHRYEEEWDYNYDEEPFFWGNKTYYITSDGLRFDEDDYEATLEQECWWLKQNSMM